MGIKQHWTGWGQKLSAVALSSATVGSAAVGLWLAGLTGYPASVRAQVPVSPNPASSPTNVRTLYVNPTVGNDGGTGSADAPLRSITAALRQASTGTVIQLSPGTYSSDTGEVFPLRLPSGVVLRGDESIYGAGYDIVGGGDFISPTMARQSITILPQDGAEIRGISVRNEGRRGYAVWTESTSPIVEHNTFTGSVHDGVFLAGASAATISGNRFYRNGANGISVLGTSTPTIVGNLIQETGYGIAIGQNSRPVVAHNRISRNRSGLVITGRSQPVLRNNVITENLEDGLVAIAESLPNLGASDEVGGNYFESNGSYNIHNATRGNIIPAHGNHLGDISKLQGEVAFRSANADGVDVATVPSLFDQQQTIPTNSGAARASTVGNSAPPPASTASPAVSDTEDFRPVPFVSPVTESHGGDTNSSGPAGGVSSIPARSAPTSPASSAGMRPGTVSSESAFAGRYSGDSSFSNGSLNIESLPVSVAPVPIANTNDIVSAARRYPARYRVLITPQSGDTIEAVRAVAPTATPAQLAGREVYLVGHYSTHSEAQTVLQQLTQEGYLATAEAIEREVDS
ncbi:MAG: DUF1565 domain-containing protein [Synechococcus sp.]